MYGFDTIAFWMGFRGVASEGVCTVSGIRTFVIQVEEREFVIQEEDRTFIVQAE